MNCPYCGQPLRPSRKEAGCMVCDSCKKKFSEENLQKRKAEKASHMPQQNGKSKVLPVVTAVLVICAVLLFLLTQTLSGDSGQQNTDYLSEATWADTSNYMFAVEVSDFDGDVFQAGTYRFYPDAVNLDDASKTPVVWDIYVSDTLYSNADELSDEEYAATVGGTEKDECTLDLQAGNYVYINYNQTLGEPTGMLQIEKQ